MNDGGPKNDNGNGAKRFFNWLSAVPIAVYGFLIAQFVTIAVWAIRLEGRVATVENHILDIERVGTVKSNSNEQRINAMGERIVIIERRQDEGQRAISQLAAATARVDLIAERVDRIVQALDTMYSGQQEQTRRLDEIERKPRP